jgi:hypothetical protein
MPRVGDTWSESVERVPKPTIFSIDARSRASLTSLEIARSRALTAAVGAGFASSVTVTEMQDAAAMTAASPKPNIAFIKGAPTCSCAVNLGWW